TESYMRLPRKERPSLWSWMQKPRNAWIHYILAIHKGKEGHWVLIKGVKLCDTYSEGRWQFVCDGPHKGARIMEEFALRGSIGVSQSLPVAVSSRKEDLPQPLRLGWSQSRKLSPNRLKAKTASVIATPGNTIIHGAVW